MTTVRTGSSFAEFVRDIALDRHEARNRAFIAKTAQPAGTLADPDFSVLGQLEGGREFRAAVARRLLPLALDSVWEIPFNTRSALQTDATTAYWIEPGAPIPIGTFSASPVKLAPRTVASIVVLSGELLRAAGAAADAAIVRILASAIARRANATFLSAAAAAAGAPAGIAESAASTASTGTTAAAFSADFETVIGLADAADADLAQASWIMSPARAAAIAAALGLENLGVRGGTLLGAPAHTDPAAGDDVLLIAADRLAVAVGSVDVSHAEQAALQMDDAPTNNSATPTATTMVSLFATDSEAIKATLTVNWAAAADSVFVITG